VYDSVQVFKTFEILNAWFMVLKKNRQPLPPTFDYDLFLDGIFITLKSDEGVSLEKTIWFLYNNFGFLKSYAKARFWEFLYGEEFIRLFLHWSWNVRNVFYRF
jgi:hypothetical protein